MELLVVLAVMGVMMGLIGFSLAGGDGAALSASQRQLLGLIQQTRAKAAIYGQPARLIVNNDETDTDKYHRYLEIVVRDANESKKWRVQGEGKFLEDGVFFIPEDDSVQFLQMIGLMRHTLIGAVKTMSSFRHPLKVYVKRVVEIVHPFVIWSLIRREILYVIMRKRRMVLAIQCLCLQAEVQFQVVASL